MSHSTKMAQKILLFATNAKTTFDMHILRADYTKKEKNQMDRKQDSVKVKERFHVFQLLKENPACNTKNPITWGGHFIDLKVANSLKRSTEHNYKPYIKILV